MISSRFVDKNVVNCGLVTAHEVSSPVLGVSSPAFNISSPQVFFTGLTH
jgi:hypothetical protein